MSRVLLLTMSLGPGGAEDQAFHLSMELRRRGWEPAVVSLLSLSDNHSDRSYERDSRQAGLAGESACPTLEPLDSQNCGAGAFACQPLTGTAREAELRAAGVPTFSLGMRPGRVDPRALIRLAAIMSRFQPQVLHSHMFHANCLARAVRLLCPAPVVISTLHSAAEGPRDTARRGDRKSGPQAGPAGETACPTTEPPEVAQAASPAFSVADPSRYPGVRLRDWIYRLTDCLADSVVAVSCAAAERHASTGAVSPKKLRVIPNAVDTTTFRPDPDRRARTRLELGLDSRFVWLAAGRLIWKKDYPTLFRAMEKCPESILLIAGEGPQDAELKQLASGLRVDARFLGRVSDMPALMNVADALVLSSLVEGLPIVLLEAAASGLPAVATNVGGACEVVADGETGLLVPPGDPALLGNAMSRLESLAVGQGSRPAQGTPGTLPNWETMSQAARSAAARFDTAVITGQWEALYRELMENSPWT